MAYRWGNNRNSDRLYFLGSKITVDSDCSHEIQRGLLLGRKVMSVLKSRDITLPMKIQVKAMFFYNSHVWMWEFDHKEGLILKNRYFWTVVSEKTLESPLDCKEIKPVNPKGNQPWIFIGKTDAKAKSNTLATWCEETTHWKRPWCWKRLRAEEGRGTWWDG